LAEEAELVAEQLAAAEAIEDEEKQALLNTDTEIAVADNKNSKKVRADSDADMQAKSDATDQLDQADKIKPADITAIPEKQTKEITNTATTVEALDLAYALPANSQCVIPGDTYPRVGVLYRSTSYAIKGQSLSNIDKLIKLYKKCGGGKLLVLHNEFETETTEDNTAASQARLVQLRQDEVKYYLLQRRVSKDDMIFPDNL